MAVVPFDRQIKAHQNWDRKHHEPGTSTDERPSELKIAKASALLRRSSAWALVGSGAPSRTPLSLRKDGLVLGDTAAARLGSST